MKEFCDLLVSKKIILKNLKEIDVKKRVLKCFEGIDERDFYVLVFINSGKSRFLKANAKALNELFSSLCDKSGIGYKKKYFFYSCELCSKAKEILKKEGFKTYAFM